MNRILGIVRERLAAGAGESDRRLLDRFLSTREESAFAELVRRHGRVVWGVCRRRLANPHDAEDAFQATFLVLLRRAARLGRDIPLGPWLHKVAVMTARNVQRGNRRRAAIAGPMAHDVAGPNGSNSIERFDLDAALLELPDRYRLPVVLCHLQGLSRREAAVRLGCPEGTLSSLLNRALARLRARLGGAAPALAALAAATAVPTGLAAATVHAAVIDSTSHLTAASLSPAVAGLTDGVLRMFWVKKLTMGLAFAVMVACGLLAGFAMRSDQTAQATASEPQAPPEDPDAAVKQLEKRLAALEKQRELLDATLAELRAEKGKLDEAKKSRAEAAAAAELGTDIAVSVGGNPSGYDYTIREVINSKVTEVHTSDINVLRTYLARAFNDPKGPRRVRVSAEKDQSYASLKEVFAACAAAGFKSAMFSHIERPTIDFRVRTVMLDSVQFAEVTRVEITEAPPKPGEIDLTKYAPKKQP